MGRVVWEANAAPCQPAAIVQGDPALVEKLGATLAARGVSSQALPSCPTLWAGVNQIDGVIFVTLKDPSGKLGTLQVLELGTAAALIEAWSRTALDPLFAPVHEPPEPVWKELEQPSPGIIDLPVKGPAFSWKETEIAPPPPRAIQQAAPEKLPWWRDLPEPSGRVRAWLLARTAYTPLVPLGGGLQVAAEFVGTGSRLVPASIDGGWPYAVGQGVSLSADLPHKRRPELGLSIEGRAYQIGTQTLTSIEGSTDPSFFAELGVPPEDIEADYQGGDTLLRFARPIPQGRFVITPSLAAGVGLLFADYHYRNYLEFGVYDLDKRAVQALVEGRVHASYQLMPKLSISTFYSASGAVSLMESDPGTYQSNNPNFPEPVPSFYRRVGLGVAYSF